MKTNSTFGKEVAVGVNLVAQTESAALPCSTIARQSVAGRLAALLSTAVLLITAGTAHAADLMKDFDSLGGNDVLLDRAKALNPEERVAVVQDRIVNLRNRVEIAPEFSSVLGSDAFDNTESFGLNVHYHITPRWSVGLKYAYYINALSSQGQEVVNNTTTTGKAWIPDIDYPRQEFLGLINWSPIYGKMNLYDLGVMHFDVYVVGGAGQVELRSGNTMTYTGGGGVALWVSQHMTTRLELRYQTYQASRFDGSAQMNSTVAGIQVGYLL